MEKVTKLIERYLILNNGIFNIRESLTEDIGPQERLAKKLEKLELRSEKLFGRIYKNFELEIELFEMIRLVENNMIKTWQIQGEIGKSLLVNNCYPVDAVENQLQELHTKFNLTDIDTKNTLVARLDDLTEKHF